MFLEPFRTQTSCEISGHIMSYHAISTLLGICFTQPASYRISLSVDLSAPNAEASNCPRPAQGGETLAVNLDVEGIFLLLLFVMPLQPMPMEDIMIAT